MSVFFEQGLELMLVGMGSVFTFLTLLVFCSMLMSELVSRFSLESGRENTDEAKLIAVISAAIAAHRNR